MKFELDNSKISRDMAKKTYAHIWAYAHNLAKYQYFWMKPILYDIYNSFARFVQFIAGIILKCLFKAKNTSKKGQNHDYLRLQIFISALH